MRKQLVAVVYYLNDEARDFIYNNLVLFSAEMDDIDERILLCGSSRVGQTLVPWDLSPGGSTWDVGQKGLGQNGRGTLVEIMVWRWQSGDDGVCGCGYDGQVIGSLAVVAF